MNNGTWYKLSLFIDQSKANIYCNGLNIWKKQRFMSFDFSQQSSDYIHSSRFKNDNNSYFKLQNQIHSQEIHSIHCITAYIESFPIQNIWLWDMGYKLFYLQSYIVSKWHTANSLIPSSFFMFRFTLSCLLLIRLRFDFV